MKVTAIVGIGGIGIFGFAVFLRLVFRFLHKKNFGFSVLVPIAVCGFCSISPSVFGFQQK